jgi:putative phosphoesterase
MKIGIVADTHDNMTQINKAVRCFNRKKVNLVIHAGDYVAPFSVIPFEKLKCDYVGVFGNNDGEHQGLEKQSGHRIKKSPYSFTFGGKKIFVSHYYEDARKAIDRGGYDLVVYGHTHEKDSRKFGKTMLINPGECGGWLYGRSSIAIVDLDRMIAEMINM